MMALGTLIAAAVLLAQPASSEPNGSPARAEVKVTQKYLLPLCLDGVPVKHGERRWRLDLRRHSLAFTMHNAPRRGIPAPDVPSGIAVVQFTPESGHRYEVEVRAPASTFSWRVWKEGEWKPVVRDRTVDRIVSSEPVWTRHDCEQRDPD